METRRAEECTHLCVEEEVIVCKVGDADFAHAGVCIRDADVLDLCLVAAGGRGNLDCNDDRRGEHVRVGKEEVLDCLEVSRGSLETGQRVKNRVYRRVTCLFLEDKLGCFAPLTWCGDPDLDAELPDSEGLAQEGMCEGVIEGDAVQTSRLSEVLEYRICTEEMGRDVCNLRSLSDLNISREKKLTFLTRCHNCPSRLGIPMESSSCPAARAAVSFSAFGRRHRHRPTDGHASVSSRDPR